MSGYFLKDTSEKYIGKGGGFVYLLWGGRISYRHFACLQPTQTCWEANLNIGKVGEFCFFEWRFAVTQWNLTKESNILSLI